MEDIKVFNLNVLFTFLNVYSLDINNDLQRWHCKSWHFLTPASSLLNSGCLEEYIGEMGVRKTRLRDRVRVYRQHAKQPEHHKLEVEEHIRICGRGSFKIFVFLQMWSNDTNLRRTYETKFQKEYKTKLNQLWQTKGVTQRFNVLMIAFKSTLTRDHQFLVPFYIVTEKMSMFDATEKDQYFKFSYHSN